MDEYNTGMDPEVQRFFRKIMATVGAGMLWIMLMAVLGLYLRLGYFVNGLDWYNGIFYFILFTTLYLLLRFLYKVWRKKEA
jgi:sterol desaturase/sphingolipid hydroxylase (fatty acid hydroxylase superfamily)